METSNLISIRKEILVQASQQMAFEVFTQKMDLWWPRTHHIGNSDMTEMIVETHVGGRWYSKHTDGTEANVGYVLTY